jgi:lipopolysaccharide biosynthesis regulator YciM
MAAWQILAACASSEPSSRLSLDTVDQLVAEGKVREAGLQARLIGQRLQHEGRYQESIAALERSSELLGPEDIAWRATREELAQTYNLAGMAAKAETVLLDLLAQFDSDTDLDVDTRRHVRVQLADHYADHEEWDRATEIYSQVVASVQSPEHCDFDVQHACRVLIRRFDAASDYQRAVDVSRTLVLCVEARVAQLPVERDDLIGALRRHSELAERAGRSSEAEASRARADRLSAEVPTR